MLFGPHNIVVRDLIDFYFRLCACFVTYFNHNFVNIHFTDRNKVLNYCTVYPYCEIFELCSRLHFRGFSRIIFSQTTVLRAVFQVTQRIGPPNVLSNLCPTLLSQRVATL